MFDGVAERYDRTNTVLSFGQDRSWRRATRAALDLQPGRARASTWAPAPASPPRSWPGRARTWSASTSRSACSRAGRQARPDVPLLAGDALALPFADATFDAVTISFGLRNVVDTAAALREMARVTRPGGRLVVCEFSHPTNAPFRTVYLSYLMRCAAGGGPPGLVQPGRLRLPGRVDPRLARPGRPGRADRRSRLGQGRLAQPDRRHRRPAPRRPRRR